MSRAVQTALRRFLDSVPENNWRYKVPKDHDDGDMNTGPEPTHVSKNQGSFKHGKKIAHHSTTVFKIPLLVLFKVKDPKAGPMLRRAYFETNTFSFLKPGRLQCPPQN